MDEHIRRTADNQKHGEETHHIVAGEEEYVEEGYEKKSLLNKVKDKAKKIKSKITPKHHTGHDGHEHNPDHENHQRTQINHDSHEDESIESDPEVHGAPIYDSRDAGRNGGVDELSDKMRDNSLDTDASGKSNHHTEIDPSKRDGQTTGSHVHFAQDPSTDHTPSNDTNREPVQEKQVHPTTYSEKISAAASSIATTAVSAKDAIVEKLGYGHKDGQEQTRKDEVRVEETEGGVKKVGSGGQTVPEYLTDKLGPGGEERPIAQVVSDVLHKRKDMQDEPAVEQSDNRRETKEAAPEAEAGSGGPQGIIGTVAAFFNKGGEANDAYGTKISGDDPQEEKTTSGNKNSH